MARCSSWKCLDTFLLCTALLMTLVAVVCWYTLFPRVYPDPDRHGGKYPDYHETECRLHNDPYESHEEDDDVECTRNDRNEWCDADDTRWGHGHRQKRSWGSGGRHRRFPCIQVRVRFFFQGTELEGILYESWLEAENFKRCSTSSCLEDRQENEHRIRKWRHQLGHRFRCYVNRHKTDDVVLDRNKPPVCLPVNQAFHAVLWPAIIAAVAFLWFLMRRICLGCCQSSIRSDPKIKPDVEGIIVSEQQAGPLPDKKALESLENGGEIILVPPFGPPPTYNGEYKDVDTVSMMSAPPPYDVTNNETESAVAKVDA